MKTRGRREMIQSGWAMLRSDVSDSLERQYLGQLSAILNYNRSKHNVCYIRKEQEIKEN